MRKVIQQFFIASLIALVPTLAHARVGEVIFAIGDAKLEGATSPIKRGDALDVGQVIVTGSNGHVHIRFDDDAFVSVRPSSSLKIERYVFDERDPKNNQVKFTLMKGTSRLITGKAGQTNKQGFRLNTPVAAIGIRGTDFIVQTDLDNTRVAVQQGGVTIAPFGQDCTAQALGPCGGTRARDLAGSLSDAFLEVRAQGSIELVQGQGRKVFALPRPEEPSVNGSGNQKSTQLPNGMQGGQQLMWGRWSPNSMVPAGYELIGQNDAFVLYRNTELVNLPTSGFVNFTLTNSEAYGREGRGAYERASVSNASFSVNFEEMRYQTKFDWTFDNQKATLRSNGLITEEGRLRADAGRSNVSISGALSGNGDTAAYLFNKRFNNDTNAYGVMYWQQK